MTRDLNHHEEEGPPRLSCGAVDLSSVSDLREKFRFQNHVQIVRDSILDRGLARPFGVWSNTELVGYAGVWTQHFPGRLMEFYLDPGHSAVEALVAIANVSETTHLEAQTNIPTMLNLLLRFGADLSCESILFEDGAAHDSDPNEGWRRTNPAIEIRERAPTDQGPEGELVLASGNEVLGAGGLMTHYNTPFVDLYMEVVSAHRRRGYGARLVQALRARAGEGGRVATARCDPHNMASRRTLRRGGMQQCGWLLSGRLTLSEPGLRATNWPH